MAIVNGCLSEEEIVKAEEKVGILVLFVSHFHDFSIFLILSVLFSNWILCFCLEFLYFQHFYIFNLQWYDDGSVLLLLLSVRFALD